MILTPDVLTIAALERAADMPTGDWHGCCYQMACVAAGLLGDPGAAVYGHYLGPVSSAGYWKARAHHPFQQHGWVTLPDGRVLDPTRWSFQNVPPHVYVGSAKFYDEGGNQFRSAMSLTRPLPTYDGDERKVRLSGIIRPDDARFHKIACLLGRDQVRVDRCLVISVKQAFWLANQPYENLAPVTPAIYEALCKADLRGFIPADNLKRSLREIRDAS